MNFSFSDNKALQFGIVKNRIQLHDREYFELIDINDPKSNQIKLNGIDYVFTYLSNYKGNKGGNSVLLKLYNAQLIDSDSPVYNEPDLVIKINKSKIGGKFGPNKRQQRFEREIAALIKCKNADFQNVINIEHSGLCDIYNAESKKIEKHQFYTMEYAPFDLKSYIEANHKDIQLDFKLNLCIELAKGLKELRSMELYHRDIKPDNIFMNPQGIWKIGDLGLIDGRELDVIDDEAEPIGPKGWMSPESMNKYLTEGKGFIYKYDCVISHQSDIFQLGKVFWYIFQHNAPIGCVKGRDFVFNSGNIYSILKTMLNYSLVRRYNDIDEVIRLLRIEQKNLLRKV